MVKFVIKPAIKKLSSKQLPFLRAISEEISIFLVPKDQHGISEIFQQKRPKSMVIHEINKWPTRLN